MYWQIWPWCFKIYRPSKIFTGPGLLAVVLHKPCVCSLTQCRRKWTHGRYKLEHIWLFSVRGNRICYMWNLIETRTRIVCKHVTSLWLNNQIYQFSIDQDMKNKIIKWECSNLIIFIYIISAVLWRKVKAITISIICGFTYRSYSTFWHKTPQLFRQLKYK